MPTYTFQEVKHREARRLKCRDCGKRFTRSKTFTNTINPFNKNANGQVKTYREVLRDVVAKGAAWQPDDQCAPCAAEVS